MGFQDDLKQGVRSGACALFNGADFLYDWALYPVVEKRFGLPPGSSPVSRAISNGADYFCDKPPEDRPPPAPGVPAAGQCPVPYIIQYSYDQYNPDGTFKSGPFTGTINDVPGSSRDKLYGPISQPFTVPSSGDGVQNQYTYHTQDGTKKTGPVGGNSSGTTAFTQWDLIRLDGEPDDCGEVPVRPELTLEQRTTEINVGGSNATLSIGKAVINGDGNILAGIVVVGDTYDYSGQINLSAGDISFNFGGKRQDGPPGDDEHEDDEDGNGLIIGARVVVSINGSIPGVTTIPQPGNNPDIYAPNLGFVAFLLEIGENTAWSKDYPVKNLQQFVEWDGALDAVGVAGTPRAGVSFNVIPVRRVSKTNPM